MNKQKRGKGAAYSPSSFFPLPLSELRPFRDRCLSLPKRCAHLQSRICPLSLQSTTARMILLTGKLVLSLPAYDPLGILHCLRISPHLPLQPHLPSLPANPALSLGQNTCLQFSGPLFTFTCCSTCPKCCRFCSSPGEVLLLLQDPVSSSGVSLTSPGGAEPVLLSASHMPAHDTCYSLYCTSVMFVYRCCFSPERVEAIASAFAFSALCTGPGILCCQSRCC